MEMNHAGIVVYVLYDVLYLTLIYIIMSQILRLNEVLLYFYVHVHDKKLDYYY